MNDATQQSESRADLPTVRWIVIVFTIVVAVVAVMAVAAVRNARRAVLSNDQVNRTHALIGAAGDVLTHLYASEAALRSYAITSNPYDQTACLQALDDTEEHLAVLQALAQGDEGLRGPADRIERLLRQRQDATRNLLELRRAGDDPRWRAALAADTGLAALTNITSEVARLRGVALDQLGGWDTENYRQAQQTRWTVWGGVALNVLLLAGAGWLVRSDIAARRRRAAALRADNASLQVEVEHRTAEVQTITHQLAEEKIEERWTALALEHQVKYNNLVINALREPVMVITKLLNISRVNPALLHWTGRTAPSLMNQPVHSLLRPAPGATGLELGNPLELAMSEGRELRDYPALLQDRLDRVRPVVLILVPLRDGDRVVGGVIILDEPRFSNGPALS